ncbi:MAG: MBL fold metallo-hydrolase [bacterium]|nr:MBL fold metallo-hydrolase [bacterium]
MKISRLILPPLDNNCYILKLDDECIIIDPASNYAEIINEINDKKIVGVIVTHYHFDHIGALNNFDENLIYDINNLKEGVNTIGKFSFEVIYTPGHKEDSITIYFKGEEVMFTGDFLFKNGVGRTDLPGGNVTDMVNSLNKIKNYNNNIKIYPGHGDYTYLKDEVINIR